MVTWLSTHDVSNASLLFLLRCRRCRAAAVHGAGRQRTDDPRSVRHVRAAPPAGGSGDAVQPVRCGGAGDADLDGLCQVSRHQGGEECSTMEFGTWIYTSYRTIFPPYIPCCPGIFRVDQGRKKWADHVEYRNRLDSHRATRARSYRIGIELSVMAMKDLDHGSGKEL